LAKMMLAVARGAYGKPPAMPKSLGERIRQTRMFWKWTQSQLAFALGTNQQTISHWEQERQRPTDAALHSLAKLFGMDTEALTSGKDFLVPDLPQPFGDLLVPANLATDLIKLPPASKKEILLVPRNCENAKQLSLNEALTIIRQSYKDGRPVWIVM